MTKQTSGETETVVVDGLAWKKHYLEDNSGHWFELAGLFGELIVEESHRGGFMSQWWPPGITVGEPVQIGKGYKTQRSAMKAGINYIKNLGKLLGTTKVVGLPC